MQNAGCGCKACGLQILSRYAGGIGGKLGWGSGGDDTAAGCAPAGAHINDVIGIGDHICVVLNHNYRCALIDQSVEYMEQGFNIQRVQANGRLIENKYGGVLGTAHLRGQLQPLGVASPRVR